MSLYQSIDDTAKPVTLLLKGDSGTGKTTKAAQFPRPVIFNFDNNLSGLRKLPAEVRKNIRIIQPRLDDKGVEVKPAQVWGNFIKQLTEVSNDASVGTIVLDSLTTLAEILMDMVQKTDDPSKPVEIQQWGEFQRYLKWLGDNLMCASDLDKHVIVIAHETIMTEKLTGKIKYLLAIGGQTKSNFDLYFTDCWRTYTKNTVDKDKPGGVDYWVRTLPTDYHTGKTSLTLPPDFKWDDKVGDILQQLAAGLPQPK